MAGAKARNWITGTVVVALLVLVGTWFLAVSPKLAEAQETRTITEDEVSRHDILRAQLANLRTQFEDIDTYKGELAGIQQQIPTTAKLSDYVRELQGIAAAHSVTLISLTPGLPTAVVPAVAVAAVEVPATTASNEAAGGTADAADGATGLAAEASTAATRLVSVPMVINAVGTYTNVASFLEALQTSASRLMLVTSLTVTTQDEAEASGGRPATAPGDVEVGIDGVFYVLPELDVPGIGAEEPALAAEPVPLPSSERNPFAPVAGS